jgi:hypothetical protein
MGWVAPAGEPDAAAVELRKIEPISRAAVAGCAAVLCAAAVILRRCPRLKHQISFGKPDSRYRAALLCNRGCAKLSPRNECRSVRTEVHLILRRPGCNVSIR